MCVSEFSWYSPLSSHQHLYIHNSAAGQKPPLEFICVWEERDGLTDHRMSLVRSRVWFLHKNSCNLCLCSVQRRRITRCVFSLSLDTKKRKHLSCSCTFSRPVLFCTLQTLTPLCSSQTISSRRCVRPAGMSDSEWERFASVCLSVLNINHTFRNMIILPWVRRFCPAGEFVKGVQKNLLWGF